MIELCIIWLMLNTSPEGIKYAGIDIKGVRAVRLGEIATFTGFGETLKDSLITVMRFTSESVNEVKQRLLDPIKEIVEGEPGMEVVLAGRDYPLHSTVLDSNWAQAEEKRDQSFTAAIARVKGENLMGDLVGQEIIYRYVLVNGGNVLLTAIDIPATVIEARKILVRVLTTEGISPKPSDHILHCSVARISALPQDGQKEVLNRYAGKIRRLRTNIAREPLKLKVGEVETVSGYDFFVAQNKFKGITK